MLLAKTWYFTLLLIRFDATSYGRKNGSQTCSVEVITEQLFKLIVIIKKIITGRKSAAWGGHLDKDMLHHFFADKFLLERRMTVKMGNQQAK